MFEDVVFKKDKNEVKRGLLTFPIAFGVQTFIIVGLILFGIFTSTSLPAPEKNAVFDPVIIVPPPPPPPPGNPEGDNKPKLNEGKQKALEKDDIVIPEKEEEKQGVSTNSNELISDTGGRGEKGDPNGEEWMKTFWKEVEEEYQKPQITKTEPTSDPEIIKALKPLYTPPPPYPPEALRLGIKGRVEATLTIDERGYVTEVTIESSPNIIFEKSVKDTVKKWRFSAPVDRKGQKVSVYLKKVFVFKF